MAGAPKKPKASTEDLLHQVAAVKSFNSTAGRPLEKRAGEALRKLPRSIDATLLQAAFERFAAESPTYLWQAFKWLEPEHAGALLAALARNDSIEATFVKAAVDGDDAAHSFETLTRIAPVIAAGHETDRITGQPGVRRLDADAVALLAGLTGDARVVGAAATAVERAPPRCGDDLRAGGMFWQLVVLLGLAADERSIAVLGKMAVAYLRDRKEPLRLFELNLLLTPAPAVTAIRERLGREHARRFEASETGKWLKEVGLTAPVGGYWRLKIEIAPVTKGTAGGAGGWGAAQMEIEALTETPRWEIKISAFGGGTRMTDGECWDNTLALTPVTSPCAFREVLDEAAGKLGLVWNTQAAKLTNKGLVADAAAIQAWLARTPPAGVAAP